MCEIAQMAVDEIIGMCAVCGAQRLSNYDSAGDGTHKRRSNRSAGQPCEPAAVKAGGREFLIGRKVNSPFVALRRRFPDIARFSRTWEDMRPKAQKVCGPAAESGFDDPSEANVFQSKRTPACETAS